VFRRVAGHAVQARVVQARVVQACVVQAWIGPPETMTQAGRCATSESVGGGQRWHGAFRPADCPHRTEGLECSALRGGFWYVDCPALLWVTRIWTSPSAGLPRWNATQAPRGSSADWGTGTCPVRLVSDPDAKSSRVLQLRPESRAGRRSPDSHFTVVNQVRRAAVIKA
jgi:hypothetical protein